jgi:hypothetical protein
MQISTFTMLQEKHNEGHFLGFSLQAKNLNKCFVGKLFRTSSLILNCILSWYNQSETRGLKRTSRTCRSTNSPEPRKRPTNSPEVQSCRPTKSPEVQSCRPTNSPVFQSCRPTNIVRKSRTAGIWKFRTAVPAWSFPLKDYK